MRFLIIFYREFVNLPVLFIEKYSVKLGKKNNNKKNHENLNSYFYYLLHWKLLKNVDSKNKRV